MFHQVPIWLPNFLHMAWVNPSFPTFIIFSYDYGHQSVLSHSRLFLNNVFYTFLKQAKRWHFHHLYTLIHSVFLPSTLKCWKCNFQAFRRPTIRKFCRGCAPRPSHGGLTALPDPQLLHSAAARPRRQHSALSMFTHVPPPHSHHSLRPCNYRHVDHVANDIQIVTVCFILQMAPGKIAKIWNAFLGFRIIINVWCGVAWRSAPNV